MKHTKLIFLCLIVVVMLPLRFFSQTPSGVNYQAIVRSSAGTPLAGETVDVRFNIRQGSPTGTSVFMEVHTTTTNQFGLINLELGSVSVAPFAAINWGTGGAYYLQIEVDDGSGYSDLGASQLLSVPYALFAKSAATGAQGFNSLIDTAAAPISACPNGGYQVLTGLDANANTVLDPGEVSSSFYVCNGTTGAPSNDTSAVNEIQALSISNDTIFLSRNGGFVVLPTITGDNDWTVNGANMTSGVLGNVGIGSPGTPVYKLEVYSPDTVIASFVGNNASASVVAVVGLNPTSTVGVAFISGTDSGIVAIDPVQNTMIITHTNPGGHLATVADSTNTMYGEVIGLMGKSKNIIRADSVFTIPKNGNNVISVNQGTFVTDSLYVIGNNSNNPGWVLMNNGIGQAVWGGAIVFNGTFASTGTFPIGNSPQVLGATGAFSIGAILFNTSPVNFGGVRDAVNMRFIAPIPGFYQIHGTIQVSIATSQSVSLEVFNMTTNTVLKTKKVHNNHPTVQKFQTIDVSVLTGLNYGDVVVLRVIGSMANSGNIFGATPNSFEVHLIK